MGRDEAAAKSDPNRGGGPLNPFWATAKMQAVVRLGADSCVDTRADLDETLRTEADRTLDP
jgi:hypothetical protein